MTEEAKQKTRKLEGEAALNLWRQGPDAWNSYIGQHPSWVISFRGINFAGERDSKGNLSFAGYRFGNSNVFFSFASFGNGDVNFNKAIFGDGNVYFAKTRFKGGNVYFFDAIFGNGDVLFIETEIDNGDLYFTGASFGNGKVDFAGADLHTLDLSATTFGEGTISFREAQITNLHFNYKNLGSTIINAEGLSIKDRANFTLTPPTTNLKSFNLLSASLDGPLTIRGDLNIVPDLRATRYSHQVDLSDLKVKLPRISPKLSWPPKLSRVAKAPKDAARLRRLKEIAEANKDHQAALRFSADENRAKRWIETSWFGSVLDMAFSAFSDYGQNILRPFVALIVLTVASMGAYKTLATATFANWWAGWAQGTVLSASNSLPFLPQSRDLRIGALKALYGTDPGLWVDALMITQGVLSFVFLFLIGLGLRNRFRL